MPLNALGDLFNAVLAQAVAPPPPARMTPEKAAVEMIGQAFVLNEAFTQGTTTLPVGSEVRPTAWDNASQTVPCRTVKPPVVTLNIPKTHLQPKRTPVAGMNPYSAGVRGQAATVKKAEATLADWLAKEDEYKKMGTTAIWTEERDRLLGLMPTRRADLNKKLIQETMYNRFDAAIKNEVVLANAAAGLSGANALDPNLIKSMAFRESEIGTSGKHLEDPPSHAVRSRFNLCQVIDSSGLAFLTFFEEEQPAVITSFGLGSMRSDMEAAMIRLRDLRKKATRTPAEEAEFIDLQQKAEDNWEVYIWGYIPSGRTTGFSAAVHHFFNSSVPPKHLDYNFWIHMAVFWLFEKKKPSLSWPDALYAYVGKGPDAVRYRDDIVKRAADAAAAAKAGKDYIPKRR